MVVHQTERNHNAVLQLLENYRLALRTSKPRTREGVDPHEVLTRYYRMPAAMATDLRVTLPQLLYSETWRSSSQSEAPGTILQVASRTELQAVPGRKGNGAESEGSAVGVEYAVLVITQMRKVHEEIPEIIQRVGWGDLATEAADAMPAPMMGGMGGMGATGGMGTGDTGRMGGFGGGFF